MGDLKSFFEPKTIAVIGASRNPSKVGYVIFKNILDGNFKGEVIPINPNTHSILNHKAYDSILNIGKDIDLAIIALPAKFVLNAVRQCKKSGIKSLIIISSGFSEIGETRLENDLRKFLKDNKMRAIGVNCLGLYDAYNNLDAMFIPRYRMRRPEPGAISFVCQSGAIGAAILDKATEEKHKFSKFISYGNATDIDESDLLDYLANDVNTKVICLYLEGIKNGEKFYKTIKKVSKIKPIVALKGGLTKEGSQAALSHTGALAGDKETYLGVFKQAGVIWANGLEEMFNIASLVEKDIIFVGEKTQIITNGGGYGIIAVDNIANSKNIKLAKLSFSSARKLRAVFPERVNIGNPLDLGGDATTERYKIALENCINDKNIDLILLIILYQTPLITTDIVDVISEYHMESSKPIIVISTGAEFTKNLSKALEERGLCTFSYPEDAIAVIDKLIWYQRKRKTI